MRAQGFVGRGIPGILPGSSLRGSKWSFRSLLQGKFSKAIIHCMPAVFLKISDFRQCPQNIPNDHCSSAPLESLVAGPGILCHKRTGTGFRGPRHPRGPYRRVP